MCDLHLRALTACSLIPTRIAAEPTRTPVAALAAALALALPVAARGELPADAGERSGPGAHLSWVRDQNAASCPDAATVQAEATRRLGHNPFSKRPTQLIEAAVTREAETYRVTIAMRDPEGRLLGSRVLTSTAGDCRSLAAAAALTVAILIDPDALSRSAPEPPVAQAPAPPPPPTAVAAPARGSGRVVALGLGGWGFLPEATLGAGLAATVGVTPSLAAGVAVGFFPEHRSQILGGDFAFGLTYAEALGCFVPRAFTLVRWEICGGAVLSAIHVVVYAPEPTNPGQRWSVGATELTRLVVPLYRSVVLEIGVGAVQSWPRRAFFIAGRPAGMDTVFAQPGIAVSGWLGAGVGWE